MEEGIDVLENEKIGFKLSDMDLEYNFDLVELVVFFSDEYKLSYDEVSIVFVVFFIVGSEEDLISYDLLSSI